MGCRRRGSVGVSDFWQSRHLFTAAEFGNLLTFRELRHPASDLACGDGPGASPPFWLPMP